MLSQIHDQIGTPPHTRASGASQLAARSADCRPSLTPPARRCASVRRAPVEERKLVQATDRHATRAARSLEDTMSLYASLAAPADVFYVVQSTGAAPGRREHRLCSLLYETRPHAHT